MKTFEMFVFGKVQGVWFRESTKTKAKEYGILGYVKNLPDSSVKIIAQHQDEQKTKYLLEWAKKGPPSAEVARFTIKEISSSEEFNNFEVR